LVGCFIKYLLACLGIVTCTCSFAQMNVSNNPINNTADHTVLYSTEGVRTESDTNRLFVIQDFNITGNEKTRPAIILRELPFQLNEEYSLSTIVEKFKKARRQLMNTGLFRNVVVSLNNLDDHNVYINIEVQEKWYIWPMAFFKPVDKNFGEWWNEKDRNMNRINYGLRLSHNNITGRNDKLRLSVMNGYTRQVSIQYYGLWLDNALKWSTSAGVSYGQNREVNYMTLWNKQVPVKGHDDFLRSYVGGFFQFNYRPAIKTTHSFGIGYTYESIADTVYKLNPSFSTGSKFVSYPELFYRLNYFDVDYIPYPTRGFLGELSLKRKGFGIQSPVNLWELSAKASQTWLVSKNVLFNIKGLGMVRLPFTQPYIGKQFIGYEGRYLQGYEYYVIDGVAGGYAKATLSRPIVSTQIGIPSQRFKSLSRIPVKVYAKTFVNSGYVYNTSTGKNNLTNRFIYSGGIGLDVVTYNDFVIKIEWSVNRLRENGLYLHQRNDF
jgi:outer membrane protein assembly factor BamA